jgi:hypothetical protein
MPIAVFVAYAEVAAARHAMDHVSSALLAKDSKFRMQPMLWRFDQLNASRWREMALQDAGRAGVVVIALSDSMPLSSGADAWLLALAARKHGARIDVLAVWNEEAWSISLQQIAGARAAAAMTPKLVTLDGKKLAARAA